MTTYILHMSSTHLDPCNVILLFITSCVVFRYELRSTEHNPYWEASTLFLRRAIYIVYKSSKFCPFLTTISSVLTYIIHIRNNYIWTSISQTQLQHIWFIFKSCNFLKWIHVSAVTTKPSSGCKSLSRKLYNVWYDTYHSIHCIVSSIKTYDLMMAQWRQPKRVVT